MSEKVYRLRNRAYVALRRAWCWIFGIHQLEIRLDEEVIRHLVADGESENIEFKQRLLTYRELAEYTVGIGNAGGGLLLMGVTDKKPRKLVGITELAPDELKKIQLSIHHSTAIRVNVQSVKTQDGLYLLGIGIPPRPRGHVFCTQDGKYLSRVGESLVGLSYSEIARMLAEGSPLRKTVAIPLILLAASAIIATFFLRRTSVPLTERDSIVIGDLENLTGDSQLAEVARQAVAVKLGESPVLRVLPEERTREVLQEMRQPEDEKLTQPVANEICVREGFKTAVTGTISTLGSHYVVGLRAADCQTGYSLLQEQVEADGDHFLQQIGKAVSDLRQKLGESVSSDARFDVPLENATTSSLEAWRFFAQGNKALAKGDYIESVRLFEDAIHSDSNFALAYAKLAQALDNLDENGKAVTNAESAFRLREHVTEHEKFYIETRYYDIVTGQVDKEIETLNSWIQAYPKDWMPRYDIATADIQYFGRFDDAVREAGEAVRLSPKDPDVYVLLVQALVGKGAYEEALATIRSATELSLEAADLRVSRFEIALLQGHPPPSLRETEWPKEPLDEDKVLEEEAWLAASSGKITVARRLIHEAVQRMSKRGFDESAGTVQSDLAVVEAEYGQFGQALEDMNSALRLAHKPNVLVNGALALAFAGQDSRANDLIRELQTRFPKDTFQNEVWFPAAKATIETRNNNPKGAFELLESARPYEFGANAEFLPIYVRAQAYLREKDGADAINEFKKIIDHRSVSVTSELYPLAYLGMARALAMVGDYSASHQFYDEFVNTLWKEADTNIPIFITAKQELRNLPTATHSVARGIKWQFPTSSR
jgi:tetratricopeptide (TPR) repeat protein